MMTQSRYILGVPEVGVTTCFTVEEMCRVILSSKSELELTNCVVSSVDVDKLCAALIRRPQTRPLSTIRFSACGLDSVSCFRLLESLPRDHLYVLGLKWNNLDDTIVQGLSSLIQSSPMLYELDLYGNKSIASAAALVWPICRHRNMRLVGLGSTAVSEAEREMLRRAVVVAKSKKVKMMSVICLVHTTAGRSSAMNVLPRDILRRLSSYLFP